MPFKNNKIEEYIDSKLRNAQTFKPSVGFTEHLMTKITRDYKSLSPVALSDKVVKYILTGFISLIFILTIIISAISSYSVQTNEEQNELSVNPVVQTSGNYLKKFITVIESVFINILNSLGLTISAYTALLILSAIVVIAFFFFGEKHFLRNRLRAASQTK